MGQRGEALSMLRRCKERLGEIDKGLFRDVFHAPDPVERAHLIVEIARLERALGITPTD